MEKRRLYASNGPSSQLLGHTLFFGLLPPRDLAYGVQSQAAHLVRRGYAFGALRPADVLHITLRTISKVAPQAPCPDLIKALGARARAVKQPSFVVSLNGVETWGSAGGGRPVVAVGDEGVIGVDMLFGQLAEAFDGKPGARFTPHMTLIYGNGPSSNLLIEPINWIVREFALIHSYAGQTRYEILDRFPLSA